jgi:uncharacterized protein (TIGR02246 family)
MKILTRIASVAGVSATCWLMTGCAAAGAKPMGIDDVRRAVDAGNAEWIVAMRTQDPERLASVFDAQGVMLGSDGAVYCGREAVRNAMGRVMTHWGPTETTIDTDGLWVVDDIAFETGRYTYTFTPEGGNRTVSRGRYVVRWKRQPDGSWKIETDLGLPD